MENVTSPMICVIGKYYNSLWLFHLENNTYVVVQLNRNLG